MDKYGKSSLALREYSKPEEFRETLVSVNPIKISDLIAKVEEIKVEDTKIRVILSDKGTLIEPRDFRESMSRFDDESIAKIETYKVGSGAYTHIKVMINDFRNGDGFVGYFLKNEKR